jgi:hypothetical protein
MYNYITTHGAETIKTKNTKLATYSAPGQHDIAGQRHFEAEGAVC